ncbi:cytochrome d ubiquinol oxidase subunit II [Anaeromyxobacter sp. SG66]|uniref:cytochrome d ubiquinol oxidase subunit II n=1 Tax=Anaeromyxobacter sp. SG66 TaxID=2925410 RepID=UPI001F55CCBA|nr:cytochrome d ubiquinol oxidase subunit II [Anaeromyxobacter sp. SG66]
MDLQVLWFVLLGVLLAGYAVLDGFDLGVGTLYLLARRDEQRRVMLNAIGPVWDGNEVWLVTFGGALFAAFPRAYATAFSALYTPLMLLILALIFRAVAIEFRSRRPSRAWRNTWDVAFFAASALSPILFGAAVGNVMMGLPVRADGEAQVALSGLLSPYALLVGVFALSLFALHGAVWLLIKTEGELHEEVRRWAWSAAGVFSVLYLLTTIFTLVAIPRATANFAHLPWAWGIVVLNVLAAGNVPRAVFLRRYFQAFASSALTVAGLVVLFGLAQWPNLVTSSLDPALSITIRNGSSTAPTLRNMAIIAAMGMPFVLGYTGLIYWVFRGKIREGEHRGGHGY